MGITISQKEISLDLQNQGFTNTIYSQQGDTDSRKLVVSLFDDGEKYIISSSSTVYLEGTRADDAVVHRKVDSISDNTVTVLFKNEELCVKGIAKYKISIYGNDGSILSSVPFKIKVYENIYNDEGIIATPEYSELQKILEDVSELEDNINKSEASRVESENKRNESESLRTESEEARKTAENQRSTAEEIRVSSENERVENEKNRTKEFAEMKKSVDGAENLNIESISSDENYQVKITNRNGEQNTSPNLLNKLQIGTVESGEYDENASATITGKFGEQKLNLRLPIGKPFKISKTYSSIDAMNQNISADLNLYEFCMIDTGNVEDEDTAKLYMRDVDGAHYITDLSGVQGIQGVKGETGETPQLTIGSVTTGNPGTNASVTITGTKENPVINFVIPRGNTGNVGEMSALSLPYNGKDDTKTTKEVIDDALEKISSNTTALDNKVSKIDGMGLSSNDYTTEEKTKLNGLNKELLDKLGESTEGNLTFNNKEINAAQMIGATADADGTSGTVPVPTAGQEKLFLRGDGTWAEAKQDLSAYYNNANYDTENNKLQLMNGDTVLKEIEISGGGGTKISPKATVNPTIINGNAKVTITWGDPDDVIADGVILSTWKGTKLVMKETGYPENENDGTVIVDNKTKNAYASTGYEVAGLTNGNTYYFKLFPYSTDGIYNYQDSNKLLGNPNLVKLDSCTNMSLSLAMGSVTVSWTDPNAKKTVDGNTATWAKTVLVYKQGSTAPSSVSDGIVAVEETTRNKYSVNGFKVNGLTNGEQYSFSLFAVSTEGVSSDATIKTANLWATLIITTGETTLYGKEVTATYGSSTVSGTFNSTGSATLQIPWIGETTIASTNGTDTATSKVTISSYGTSYNKELSFLKIVTFANGTDEEISAMIQAHYNNKINIADYWAVGDTRTVSLSAMEATGVGESHRAQDVKFVIGDFDHDDLKTPINGHSKAAVTLLQKDCLMDASNASNPVNGSKNTENGYMNSSYTTVGGWKDCSRRTWCNNIYFNALPSEWQSMVKTVNKKVSVGNGKSTIETVQDNVFLAAEIEILGSTTNSFAGEGAQYQYYKNATANRYKMPKWSSSSVSQLYWERSPASHNYYYCTVSANGYSDFGGATSNGGVAPCLCI